MARKDLLKGLMGDLPDQGETEPQNRPAPRYTKGAIGAVSQSIADLKSRSVVDLDPHAIEAAGIEDRLDWDDDEHQRLIDSIREYGQQVPVLVRLHPEKGDKYQIVYGRRRVLAMRDLGQPVKAMIRDLDDDALIMAQGQENTARRDLSFIEKANFALQMAEAGYPRKAICDALNVDKTVISRMISIAETLTPELMKIIGAAPSVGRDRWLAYARLWKEQDLDAESALAMLPAICPEGTSDDRFEALFAWLQKRRARGAGKAPAPPRAEPQKQSLYSATGSKIGLIRRTRSGLEFTIDGKASDGFDDWLADNIAEIHRDWLKARGE